MFAWGVARFLGEAGAYARELKPGWHALNGGDVAGFFAAIRPVAVDVAGVGRPHRPGGGGGALGRGGTRRRGGPRGRPQPPAPGNRGVGEPARADEVPRGGVR